MNIKAKLKLRFHDIKCVKTTTGDVGFWILANNCILGQGKTRTKAWESAENNTIIV